MAANNIIKTEEIEAYTYGLELIIPKVILYAVILVVSLITEHVFNECRFCNSVNVPEKILGGISL